MKGSKYHSDRPITKPVDDLFGRSAFAHNVVKIVSNFNIDENFVIGLYAKWGMGKTSTINLIQSELDKNDSLEGIYVNAWTLEGSPEKILWNILDQISQKLTGKSIQSRLNTIGKQMEKVSSGMLPFEMDAEFDFIGEGRNETKVSLGKIMNGVGYVGRLLASTEGIKKAKEKVEKTISEKGVKIVVFIDDIDRLNKSQIIDVFRLLSNIANYEGITFVLPFDKEYVSAAIEEQLPKGQGGDDYLEKIVQVPLHLPTIPRYTLDAVFTDELLEVFKINKIVVDQQEIERFKSLYYSSDLNTYIDSPRAINKMINVLHSVLPINYGEANSIDTVAIEMIRVFDEEFYRNIYSNKDTLLKQRQYGSYGDSDEKIAERKRRIVKTFGKERRLAILKDLFPQVQQVIDGHGEEDGSSLRVAQRIASSNYFEIYFSHFDETYGVSDKKIIALLSNAKTKGDIDEGLSIINETNFEAAIQTINDRCSEISSKLEFSKSLLDLAARLPNTKTALTLNPLEKVLFTIDDILKPSTTKLSDYVSILHHTFDQGHIEALPFVIRQAVLYSKKHESHEEPTLNEAELKEYEEQALTIIRKVADEGKMPIDSTNDHHFLYSYWADYGDKLEIEKYLKKHIKTANAAIDFVSQFLGRWSSLMSGSNNDYHRSDLNKATYEEIGRYINRQHLYELIVKDNNYKKFKYILPDAVEYLDRDGARRDERRREISRVGNEHTDEFRTIIAQQFIHLYENEKKD